MRKPQRLTAVPAAPATIDAGVLVRSRILEVLRAKVEEIGLGGRFEDRSHIDEAGPHHARGGFWNSDTPSVSEGYGKGDVEDMLRQLRQHGIRLNFEDADAFLSQLIRTGALNDVEVIVSLQDRPLTVRLDLDCAVPAPQTPVEVQVGSLLLVEQNPNAYVVRPARATGLASTQIVLLHNRVPMCTCRVSNCPHVLAVLAHREPKREITNLKNLRLSDPEHTAVVRTLVEILAKRGLYAAPSKRHKGGQPRNPARCAFQLLLRAQLGRGYTMHADAAMLVRLGLLDRPAGSGIMRT
jgi:hypothetical protein